MNLGVDITGNGIATALAGDKITLINHWMNIKTSSFLLLMVKAVNAALFQGLMNGIPFLSVRRA